MTKRYVYFAHLGGSAMKVGISKHPRKRAAGLGLVLIQCFEGNYELEQAIHRDLAPYRINQEFYSYPEAELYLEGMLRGQLFADFAEDAAERAA